MHRNATLREYNGHFDSWLPDQESLLIQLCNHLYHSGFVFHDSSEIEIEAGGSVISDFFEQEADVLRELVERKRLNAFRDYLQNYQWSTKILQKKLCQRIQKAFNQLAQGKHHHFNIRQSIAQGLRQAENHPLYDLLLYIETYYCMILEQLPEKDEDSSEDINYDNTKFKLEDLVSLRIQLKERLDAHQFVKGFMMYIAKERGVTPESLVPEKIEELRKFPYVKFFRSAKPTVTEKKNDKLLVKKNESVETKIKVDESKTKSSQTSNLEDQTEIFLEADLEQFETELTEENSVTNNEVVEVPNKNQHESKISTNATEDDSETKESAEVATQEMETELQAPQAEVSAVSFLNDVDDSEDEEFFDDSEDGLLQVDSDDDDVVFGSKKITLPALENFVRKYPDSTLKFLLRRNLDGRPLAAEIENVYLGWEQRGLSKGRLKKYVLKIMEWSEIPESPALELLQIIRDRIYEISENSKK